MYMLMSMGKDGEIDDMYPSPPFPVMGCQRVRGGGLGSSRRETRLLWPPPPAVSLGTTPAPPTPTPTEGKGETWGTGPLGEHHASLGHVFDLVCRSARALANETSLSRRS